MLISLGIGKEPVFMMAFKTFLSPCLKASSKGQSTRTHRVLCFLTACSVPPFQTLLCALHFLFARPNTHNFISLSLTWGFLTADQAFLSSGFSSVYAQSWALFSGSHSTARREWQTRAPLAPGTHRWAHRALLPPPALLWHKLITAHGSGIKTTFLGTYFVAVTRSKFSYNCFFFTIYQVHSLVIFLIFSSHQIMF